MQTEFSISLNQLTYLSLANKTLFSDLSLVFATEKSGLVGKNGVGKSTLLRLIMGELLPHAGTILTRGKIACFSQHFFTVAHASVASVLGVAEKIAALERIEAGSCEANDFILLNDDWSIRETTAAQLAAFNLAHLSQSRDFTSLSGGEQTRVRLAAIFLSNPDFILLDEPTNNLDKTSRQFFYRAIEQWSKGLLVVSHDRELLNRMDQIIEMTSVGVNVFGGHFDDYCKQKSLLAAAQERQLLDAKKSLNKVQSSAQASREKHEKRQGTGKVLRKSGSQAPILLDAMKERSSRTQGEMQTKHQGMLDRAQGKLSLLKDKVEIIDEISLDLAMTFVPNGKIILEMENVTFQYADMTYALIADFDLQIQGAERIAICGDNGSGKTTLIKLMLQQLQPQQGTVFIGTPYVSYFDQQCTQLNVELSVLENFLLLNPDANHHAAHAALAKFLFKNVSVNQRVKDLSGGERLRALLACVLSAKHPPQLLILDEPTNHLDLVSIEKIEMILRSFQGALIVISHDEVFLDNLDITQRVLLKKN